MVTRRVIIDQLKKIGFNYSGWGRSEVSELPNIILEDEEIYECVNGIYDGGFALLVATNVRVLLIDKKPLNYLTVEDMRFDMISEMDYSHRLFGANISISSGDKHLNFRSYNQPKLRKLIGHVQHCMADSKKKQDTHQEGQIQHLEQINKQLQSYLVAQQQYQQQMQSGTPSLPTEPPKPSNELADYLYAQSLLARHNQQLNDTQSTRVTSVPDRVPQLPDSPTLETYNEELIDIYDEGKKEVFETPFEDEASRRLGPLTIPAHPLRSPKINIYKPLEIHPLQIAYSKLPFVLRSRKLNNLKASQNTQTIPTIPSSEAYVV